MTCTVLRPGYKTLLVSDAGRNLQNSVQTAIPLSAQCRAVCGVQCACLFPLSTKFVLARPEL